MDLLTIKHIDFTMTIECAKFDGIWQKAIRNIGVNSLHSTYSWSEGVLCVEHTDIDGNIVELIQGSKAPAVFFDNAEYPIWVNFEKGVSSAQFGSALQSENEGFCFRHGILAGFLNYGNEIGKSEICILYTKCKEQKQFTFGYEVLSTKLNYHEHWRKIIEDIENEYRMLSLDYLKRTFHGFNPDTNGEKPDLVWWSIFSGEQEKFKRAVRNIIERPRHRLHEVETYMRADKLKHVPSSLENEIAEHRRETSHLYRVNEQIQSHDTLENRFLKYSLNQIMTKYEQLEHRVETIGNLAPKKILEMRASLRELKQLCRNPFFRTIGKFKGMNQESLILQKATSYSQVYRTWNLLRRAYSLNDGMYRLETKDIATLYEIWCFIEVSHIVKEQLGIDIEVEQRNRMDMNGVFTWELGKGENSRILFCKDGVELAELVYNPKHTERENDSVSIENLVVKTVPQKPDIVLQLIKHDLQKDMKMTYLFDAKYRIGGNVNGVDTPPDDAINQMHRYRDAIYYKDNNADFLKKEVIGGYILFPGNGNSAAIEVSKFYKSIADVNIGAFPLRPKDVENRKLLEKFISELIGSTASNMLVDTIPQKGLYYTTEMDDLGDMAMVAVCRNKEQMQWILENHRFNVPLKQVNEAPLMMKAKYLLLHLSNEQVSDRLIPIAKGSYEVWPKERLWNTDGKYRHQPYPYEPSQDSYFVLKLGTDDKLPENIKGLSFNFANAKYIGGSHRTALAFVKVENLKQTIVL